MSKQQQIAAPAPLTHKEARYVRARLEGKTEAQAMRDAGFPVSFANNPGKLQNIDAMRAEVDRLSAELGAHALREGLIDAVEIHEQLTDLLRGDIADLYNPTDPKDPRYSPAFKAGDLLPVPLWPLWARQGGVEILDEPNMVHSDDGGGGSWDQKGRKIKVRVVSRAKSQELAARLRAVNAIVSPTDKLGDGLNNLAHAINQRINEGRQRAAMRNVTPEIQATGR